MGTTPQRSRLNLTDLAHGPPKRQAHCSTSAFLPPDNGNPRSNQLTPHSSPQHKAATAFSKPPLPPCFLHSGGGESSADLFPNSRFCRIPALSDLSQHMASLSLLLSLTPPSHEFWCPHHPTVRLPRKHSWDFAEQI